MGTVNANVTNLGTSVSNLPNAVWAVTYNGKTCGQILQTIAGKVSLLGLIPTSILPTQVNVTTPNTVSVSLVRGDDYNAETGVISFTYDKWIPLSVTSGSPPVTTTATIHLTARTADSSETSILSLTRTVNRTETTQTVTFTPTHTQTGAMPLGTANFDVQATLADGSITTLVLGQMTVIEDYTR